MAASEAAALLKQAYETSNHLDQEVASYKLREAFGETFFYTTANGILSSRRPFSPPSTS